MYILFTKTELHCYKMSNINFIPAETHFLRSNTNTVPSLALAPTLSPRLFQHTSNIPPVP